MRILSLFLIFFSLFQVNEVTAETFKRGAPKDEVIVEAATNKVLVLLDDNEIGKAWDEASVPLQKGTSRLVFIAGIKAMRGTVGDFRSRKLKGIGFLKDLPEGPQGFYSAALFETTFERTTVEEKLVFYQDGATWRLAGYFLRKHLKKDLDSEK